MKKVADGAICAQPRVTVSPRWTLPVRRTSPYTPTWTSLWRAAVRRIPLSFGRSLCGSVVRRRRRSEVLSPPSWSPRTRRHRCRDARRFGPEAPDLEAALRVELSQPVERRRGEHMDGGEVEEHAGWHRLVRHGRPVGELGDVGPVLLEARLGRSGDGQRHRSARAPVSSSPKRAPPPGAPSADRRLDPRHAGAAAGPGCSGRRNCNVNLDERCWGRPDLDCEPQQARGIPRNLRLDETMMGRSRRCMGTVWWQWMG